jgi:hypothetical protein
MSIRRSVFRQNVRPPKTRCHDRVALIIYRLLCKRNAFHHCEKWMKAWRFCGILNSNRSMYNKCCIIFRCMSIWYWKKEVEKIEKYQDDLKRQLRWKISKYLYHSYCHWSPGLACLSNAKKTCILGAARIIRRVVDIYEANGFGLMYKRKL